MAKSRRYTTSRRTTAARRAQVKQADSTGVVKSVRVSHGGRGRRTVNKPKNIW